MKETTASRIKTLLEIKNMSQAEFVKRTGLGKSTVSQYVSGKRLPKQNILHLIARTYGISEAWLMGFDVPMEKEKNDAYNLGATMADIVTGSDEDMSEVMEYYSKISKLTKEQKECVYDFIDVLIAKNESAE